MDALQVIVEEVALEGLDGITVPSLWIRLQNRVPPFPLLLDEATREYIWKCLVSDHEIELFLLPQPRMPINLYDRFSEIDPETGIQEVRSLTPAPESSEVYPVNIVLEDKDGIQGSCVFYKQRKPLTHLIRSKDLKPCTTLKEALERWDERLVIVASQKVRFRTLLGHEGDPDLKLSDYSYCILERLGRARWQGELQRDLHSRAFKTDPGKLHYLRKSLVNNGLITLQSHVIRQPSGAQQHSILLLLKRFHVDRRSKYDILMEKTSNILASCPDKTAILLNLRDQLCLSEKTFKKVYQYMIATKMAQTVSIPLQQLTPNAEATKTKKGASIMVRCLKLLKTYGKKEDDEEEEEEEEEGGRKSLSPISRDMERDLVTQAYETVLACGTKGISQSALRTRLHVGKLESRMLCRLLVRQQLIKGFMEDEGRQRTTKYISNLLVEQSDLSKQFAKEKARSEQLRIGLDPSEKSTNDSTSHLDTSQEKNEQVNTPEMCSPKASASKKQSRKTKKKLLVRTPNLLTMSKHSIRQSTPLKGKLQKFSVGCSSPELVPDDDDDDDLSETQADKVGNTSTFNKSVDDEGCMTFVEEMLSPQDVVPLKHKKSLRIEKPHQTYRLLKRKNLIVEWVRSLRVIESLFTIQKMIMDEEKLDGVSTKCCKKSIVRLLRSLSKEGMLKVYHTTVIQDGISKKVEFIVHPSIAPDDPLIKSAIEQIRFRISSSHTAHRIKVAQEMQEAKKKMEVPKKDKKGDPEKEQPSDSTKFQSRIDEKMGIRQLKDYKPSIVPGLGRSIGFLPKMPRLRLVHSFLWYLVYGHPQKYSPEESNNAGQVDLAGGATSQTLGVLDETTNQEAGLENVPSDSIMVDVQQEVKEIVYVDELTWKRYIPPLPVHREFGYGWVLTSDILLSLPLSLFVQVIQVSYKVDGLDNYLNDPIKQHYLIRFLPFNMKRQLLYKRKYIFSVFESLQRLSCMGLLQFGPVEKFQEKDQVFVFLKKKGTIVDTTLCEPHYNLVLQMRPFERRCYALDSAQDVEKYWFDMQCVCLNTPLGVIRKSRTKPNVQTDEPEPDPEPPERPTYKYLRLAASLYMGWEVIDDGAIPGDGQGAAGLDSCFFSHLKRNWIWTCYPINKTQKPGKPMETCPTLRLKSFLNKYSLSSSMRDKTISSSDAATTPLLSTLYEDVRIASETSERNKVVQGGKCRKRKRRKVEAKPARKKRKVSQQKKPHRLRFYDEADRSALKRMTRQRVTWTQQEDSLLMLCRVASHFLNRKVKRPFVPWQVVRDILHSHFELSLDKTSLSVGRRSRYIMKNPQTDLNFKICLAEVHQNKFLIEDLQNRKNNYDDPQVCASEYKEFVAVLRQKFSSTYGDSDFDIPDCKEELFGRFKVYKIGEICEEPTKDTLRSEEDIHSVVLSNLIQSTLVLSNSQMKPNCSFQTFRVCNMYKQDILYQAFHNCQKRSLVNRRRVGNVHGPKKSRALPFMPMSYQLSQAYYRYFTWRFPNTICTEAHQLLEILHNAGKEDWSNTFHFQDRDEIDTDMVQFPLDAPGGFCMATLSLMTLGMLSVNVFIPEHLVVVDSSLVDSEVAKNFAEDMVDDDHDEDGAEESKRKKKIEVKPSQASHTNYLLMRGYCMPGIVSVRNLNTNDNIVVNPCIVRMKLRHSPMHDVFAPVYQSSLAQETPTLPTNFTRVLQPWENSNLTAKCLQKLSYSTEDLQAVTDIHRTIEASKAFGCERMELTCRFSNLMEVQDCRTKTVLQYLEDLINLEEVLEVGGNSVRLVAMKYAEPWLVHIIKLNNEPSADVPVTPYKRKLQPENDFQEPDPKKMAVERQTEEAEDKAEPTDSKTMTSETGCSAEAAAELQSNVLLLESDKEAESFSCKDEEMTTSNPPQAEDTDTSCSASDSANVATDQVQGTETFISRPWRIVDGSLNRPVCKGMLEALLFHIMTKPGLPEQKLVDHYRAVLQPVVVVELLQGLISMGCVQKKYMVGHNKASLFSAAPTPEVREQTEFQQNVIPFYEPTVDCCLKLCKVFPNETNWNKWVQYTHS